MAQNILRNCISFLRNGNLCNSKQEAIEKLINFMQTDISFPDGTIILSRYKPTNSNNKGLIKTILGITYNDGKNKTISVFEPNKILISN